MVNSNLIEKAIQNYFTGIFTKDVEAVVTRVPQGKFPLLSEKEWNSFNAAFVIEEVILALFEMSPLKALGPNGFHALFNQKAWKVVGNSVFK